MKIIAAEVFVTSPSRNFVTLRITTEDGVTGIGDGTLNGRELAVAAYLKEHVAQVEIVDPLVVRFHLKAAWPDFMTIYGTTASAAGLILPAGWSGPAFLALPNHFAIRTYNNSTSYALGIGLLADRFAGGGPLVAAWPVETPLSLADRMAAQIALGRLGFDPGPADCVVGAGTRKALRAWQADRKLPADGYLSSDMVARLKAQAGIS